MSTPTIPTAPTVDPTTAGWNTALSTWFADIEAYLKDPLPLQAYASSAALESAYPAANWTGSMAIVWNGSVPEPHVSDGNSWINTYDDSRAYGRWIHWNSGNGGTSTDGSWIDYPTLNREEDDDSALGVLSANRLDVVPGSYRMEASIMVINSGAVRLRLYDVDNSQVVGYGYSCHTRADLPIGNNAMNGVAFLNIEFEVVQTTLLRLQYQVEDGFTTYGLGNDCNLSGATLNNIYATLELWRK